MALIISFRLFNILALSLKTMEGMSVSMLLMWPEYRIDFFPWGIWNDFPLHVNPFQSINYVRNHIIEIRGKYQWTHCTRCIVAEFNYLSQSLNYLEHEMLFVLQTVIKLCRANCISSHCNMKPLDKRFIHLKLSWSWDEHWGWTLNSATMRLLPSKFEGFFP